MREPHCETGQCLNSSTSPDTFCSSSSTSSSYSYSRVPIGNWSATSPILQRKYLKNWLRRCNRDQRGEGIFISNMFAVLMQTLTGISSFPMLSFKGLALCLFSYSTSESSSPVRSCGCLSLVLPEVCSLPPPFPIWCQPVPRFCRTQRSPYDKLWGGLSSGDSCLRHDASI